MSWEAKPTQDHFHRNFQKYENKTVTTICNLHFFRSCLKAMSIYFKNHEYLSLEGSSARSIGVRGRGTLDQAHAMRHGKFVVVRERRKSLGNQWMEALSLPSLLRIFLQKVVTGHRVSKRNQRVRSLTLRFYQHSTPPSRRDMQPSILAKFYLASLHSVSSEHLLELHLVFTPCYINQYELLENCPWGGCTSVLGNMTHEYF